MAPFVSQVLTVPVFIVLSIYSSGCSSPQSVTPQNYSPREVNLVSSNILQRTFKILYGQQFGTAFAVTVDKKQYLVTAAHVLTGLKAVDSISIEQGNIWHPINVKNVGSTSAPIDIAVIAPEQQVAPEMPLTLTSKGVIVSGDYFFLGYPYGLSTSLAGYPIPLIKRALCSGFMNDASNSMVGFYLDGINNPGFSGGPVVVGDPSSPQIFAVISGFRYDNQPIFDETGQAQKLFYKYNTGIILAYDIRFALDLIKNNPIGFPLP